MEETFSPCTFGTPLNPIDEDDKGAHMRPKPIAVHEQIVTDEKGRRRFHGAFTGGFSAGYFNTAGSRDGWTPKTFKSSRSKERDHESHDSEANAFQKRVEDYMDDEDMAEFGIAPKKIQPSSNFFQKSRATQENQSASVAQDSFEQRNARVAQISSIFKGSDYSQKSALPFGQPVLEQLFVPIRETIGVRLLREMGWKPGQGIGPRINRRSKKIQKHANRKLYDKGNLIPPESSEEEEDNNDELLSKYREFLFAPDDTSSIFTTKPKDNLFGIAYKGLDRREMSSSEHFNLFTPVLTVPKEPHRQNLLPTKSRKIVGQAFGVGVYEEDDEDIYAKDDVSRYDFCLDGPISNKQIQNATGRVSRWEESIELSPCLPGFVPANVNSKLHDAKNFPLPLLPKNYKPRPIKRSRFEPITVQPGDEYSSIPQGKSVPTHDETTPANLGLIDTKLAKRETADMHIKAVSATNSQNKTFDQSTKESTKELRELVESIQNQHKAAALVQSSPSIPVTRFKPYAKDPVKQKRYEQYILCLKYGRRDALALLQPKDMTEWERNREQSEFDRAAILYHSAENQSSKPTTGGSVMASKFVSSNVDEELDVGKEASSVLSGETKKRPLTDAEKAAEMKCYGKLTREKVDWHPSRILCIRFNVKQPYGDSSIIGVPAGYKCRLDLFGKVDQITTPSKKISQESIQQRKNNNVHNVDKDTEVAMSLKPSNHPESSKTSIGDTSHDTFKKASNALFKAIFLDSDESNNSDNDNISENDEKDAVHKEKEINDVREKEVATENVETRKESPHEINVSFQKENSSPDNAVAPMTKSQKQPKGLFANIDFASLKNRRNDVKEGLGEKKDVIIGPSRKRPVALDFIKEDMNSDDESNEVASEFGPNKPQILPVLSDQPGAHRSIIISDTSESDEWIENSIAKSKKRTHSKSKKKKDKKSKSKKGKRKHHKGENQKHRRHSKKEKVKLKKKRKRRRRSSSSNSSSTSSDYQSSSTDSSG